MRLFAKPACGCHIGMLPSAIALMASCAQYLGAANAATGGVAGSVADDGPRQCSAGVSAHDAGFLTFGSSCMGYLAAKSTPWFWTNTKKMSLNRLSSLMS